MFFLKYKLSKLTSSKNPWTVCPTAWLSVLVVKGKPQPLEKHSRPISQLFRLRVELKFSLLNLSNQNRLETLEMWSLRHII